MKKFLPVFWHLSNRRNIIVPPMGGQIINKEITDEQVLAYDKVWGLPFNDMVWFNAMLNAADQIFMKKANKQKQEKPSK